MAKVKKVKWAVSSEEPADLQDFLDNDDIVKKNGGELPNKGVYRLVVRRMYVKPNKNDDDRVGVMLIMDEPKKSKSASYNGYLVRDGFNINDQGTPFLKRFLRGMGLKWKDFHDASKEKEDGDKRELVQIGRMKFGSEAKKDVHIKALLKESPADDYNDSPFMEVQRYIPSEDAEPETTGDEDAADMSEPAAPPPSNDLNADAVSKMKPKKLIALAGKHGIKQKKIDKAGNDKEALAALLAKELNLPPF
jgi:hypothetical protein